MSERLLRNLAIVTLILFLLWAGRIVWVPLSVALLLSFIAYPLCRWQERHGITRVLAIGISLVILMIPVAAIIVLLINQVGTIGQQWPFISEKLNEIIQVANLPFGFKIDSEGIWFRELVSGNAPGILAGVLTSASTVVQLVIIPFYVALMLYHRRRLVNVLKQMLPSRLAPEIDTGLQEAVVAYYNFIKGMVVVYVVVGLLNSTGLLLLGIPDAFVFGFTASILTFIPYIGIIIGSLLPAMIAWGMYDSVFYPLAVIGVFAVVQALEAYLIFPLAVSYKIKVNTLVTLVAIFAGGVLWGAAGMILFIPFLAILKLLSAHVTSLKPVNTLLGN